jgi:type IV pilus assembly protein PilQ
MRRQFIIKALSILCILFLFNGITGQKKPLVDVQKILIESSPLSAQVILESKDDLFISGSQYSKNGSPTLTVHLRGINADYEPQIILDNSSIITNVRFQSEGKEQALILIDVKEKVPYRFFHLPQKTIIELFPIQKTLDRYMSAPNVVKRQEAGYTQLKKIDVAQTGNRVDVIAEVTGLVNPQIFVLGNPLRLVADLYNTVLQAPLKEKTVNSMGIINVRSAQFERGNPNTIARIVFDLTEPKLFSLDSTDKKVTFSFFKESVSLSSPVTSQIEKKPAPTPEPAQKTAANLEEKTPPKKSKPSPEEKQTITPQSQVLSTTEEVYSGELINFRVRDLDLRDAILTLTSIANLNVVFNPNVKGTVTVDLVAIPWDQALDLILKENQMGRTIEGNVLRIVPIDILTKEQEEQRKLAESRELAGPKVHRTFELSYARASSIESLLKGKISDRGEIIVDERTNTIIISDVKERVNLIEQLIRIFDKATPQVSIEAKVIEATSNFVRNLGIQWGWKGVADPFYGNQTSLQFPNKILSDGALIPQGIATKGIAGPLGGYAINLPAPSFSTALGFSFANVLDTFRIDMALSALETSGEGRIISTPSIITQNNTQAEIIQGRQIPLQTTANFTVTTRYQNAALELKVTPQIAHDGTITLTLDIQNNAADFGNLVNGIPPLITQSIKTTVTIRDGGTTVIGGIYRTEDSITRDKVPFLHKIPILGNLFKSSARKRENRELLIFITPRIIK